MLPTRIDNRASMPHNNKLRIVYFGMLGQFSIPPLRALLDANYDVCGVVVPSDRGQAATPSPDIVERQPMVVSSPLPLVNPYLNENIVHIAWERGIPVFEVHRLGRPETLATLRLLKPDVGCVACFSRRLPRLLLELPRYGFFNVHPSLLPAYAGPEPLFWTFHDDAPQGVSIHVMDEDLDTGPVVAQAPVTFQDGIPGEEADRQLAMRGGQLLLGVVEALQAGTLTRVPQAAGGPHARWPTADDFEISVEWSARRIFNFIRATTHWEQPYPIHIAGQHFLLASALSYASAETLPAPFNLQAHTISIQCTPGVLHATLA